MARCARMAASLPCLLALTLVVGILQRSESGGWRAQQFKVLLVFPAFSDVAYQ